MSDTLKIAVSSVPSITNCRKHFQILFAVEIGQEKYWHHALGNINTRPNKNLAMYEYVGMLESYTYLSQTILHRLNADSRIISSCGCPSVWHQASTMLKHLLFWNCLDNQSQILCEASIWMGESQLYCGIWVTWPRCPPMPIYGKTKLSWQFLLFFIVVFIPGQESGERFWAIGPLVLVY